jgi:RimJ/RimL family protein N-acetyltransferase
MGLGRASMPRIPAQPTTRPLTVPCAPATEKKRKSKAAAGVEAESGFRLEVHLCNRSSERLRLRAIEPDRDAAPMLALLNDPGFVRFIGDRNVRSEAQARDYIALRVLHSYALNGFGMYAIERLSDGAWLGNAGLVRRDGLPGPDIGYAVLSEFAGQGYAGEAARAVFAHARAGLGLQDLYGITDLDNVVSGKILLGLGMQERGVIQLPGVDSPSRLYATPGAAEV